jgi:putative hydrolase of the HAD superfamily
VLSEFGLAPAQFAMIGNSLRSDIVPVLELGGWGVHMPYHVTWIHETHAQLPAGTDGRVREVASPAGLPAAVASLAAAATAALTATSNSSATGATA